MDGWWWMDGGWMDVRADEWVDGWMDVREDEWVDEWMDG
jgi:hypothetical protein